MLGRVLAELSTELPTEALEQLWRSPVVTGPVEEPLLADRGRAWMLQTAQAPEGPPR